MRLFNEIFSPFNRFHQIFLVLFNLYNQLKIIQYNIHREGHKQSEQFIKNKIGLLSIVLRQDSAQLAHPIPVRIRIRQYYYQLVIALRAEVRGTQRRFPPKYIENTF